MTARRIRTSVRRRVLRTGLDKFQSQFTADDTRGAYHRLESRSAVLRIELPIYLRAVRLSDSNDLGKVIYLGIRDGYTPVCAPVCHCRVISGSAAICALVEYGTFGRSRSPNVT